VNVYERSLFCLYLHCNLFCFFNLYFIFFYLLMSYIFARNHKSFRKLCLQINRQTKCKHHFCFNNMIIFAKKARLIQPPFQSESHEYLCRDRSVSAYLLSTSRNNNSPFGSDYILSLYKCYEKLGHLMGTRAVC